MYRLLIVDDEEIIVNGLYEIFRGMRELDLDVYRAYSGEEAIEWLNRTRIDIVLTDINMPGMDGMQLLDQVLKRWPNCRVIFLTGYSEFEYVYRAIQHPGVSYLLKTEDHEKVVEAVAGAISSIRREVSTEDLIRRAKEQMDQASALFQSNYLLHLLRAEDAQPAERPQFETFAIPLRADAPVLLLVGRADARERDRGYAERMQLLHSIRLLASESLGPRAQFAAVMDERHRLIWFVQPVDRGERGYERTLVFLKGALEALQGACRDSLGTRVDFALSGEPADWAAVPEVYAKLTALLNYRVGSDLEMLLVDTEFASNLIGVGEARALMEAEADAKPLEALLQRRSDDALEAHLESGNGERFLEALAPLLEALAAVRSKHSNLAIEAYSRVSLLLLSHINRWNLSEKLAFRIGQHKLMRMDAFERWAEASDYLREMAEQVFALQRDDRAQSADNAVVQIQRFIEAHLGEDLSLVRLAEQARLNPSYLSRLYKQVTGANLSDFIEAARIQRAKSLLRESRLKVHEVARQVGYETAASFTRFFRKATGISPQEYREARHKYTADNDVKK